MSYPYGTRQIQDILKAEKCLPEGNSGEFKKTGKSSFFETRQDSIDGPFVDMH